MTIKQSDLVNSLQTYLASMVQLRLQSTPPNLRSRFRFLGMEHFVLDQGEPMLSLDAGKRHVPYSQKKQCFSNAAKWAIDDSSLTYCEGYVMQPDLPVPIHHAWLVTEDNKVVDPTLGQRKGSAYWGVRIDTKTLCTLLVRNGYYGLFSDGITVTDLVLGLDPQFPYREETDERTH